MRRRPVGASRRGVAWIRPMRTPRTIAALALLALGCFGTETGNPPFAPSVAGDTGTPMGVVPQLAVSEGWMAVEDVAFEPSERCGAEGVVVRGAPAALALGGGRSLETDPVLEEGEYCALRFERVAWTSDEPAALSGATLALDAALSDGTTVRIRSTRAGAVRLSGEPFRMSEDAGGLLVFADESLLFNGVSFTDARREPDGSIILDEATNTDLLDRVEAQLAGALFLYRDEDGDGLLSEPERRAGPLAAAAP